MLCTTVQGLYADRLAKSTPNYCNASRGIDCIFVVCVLVEQMYTQVQPSMGKVNVGYWCPFKVLITSKPVMYWTEGLFLSSYSRRDAVQSRDCGASIFLAMFLIVGWQISGDNGTDYFRRNLSSWLQWASLTSYGQVVLFNKKQLFNSIILSPFRAWVIRAQHVSRTFFRIHNWMFRREGLPFFNASYVISSSDWLMVLKGGSLICTLFSSVFRYDEGLGRRLSASLRGVDRKGHTVHHAKNTYNISDKVAVTR